MSLKEIKFKITDDPEDSDSPYHHYSPSIRKELGKFQRLVSKKSSRILPKLIKAIKKYPGIPAFQNYLSVYYMNQGQVEKAQDINLKICQNFPDYSVARINLANACIAVDELEQAEELLGPALHIKLLYPQRNVFIWHEIESYESAVIRLLTAQGDAERLGNRLPYYKDVFGIDDELYKYAETRYRALLLFGRNKDFEERTYDESLARTEAPVFQHPEVEDLYHHRITDDASTFIPQLLALPPESLQADLRTLLRDSIHRFHYWMDHPAGDVSLDWILWGILLLGEIGPANPDNLEVLLDILRQGNDFVDMWYGYMITEDWYVWLYASGEQHLDQMVAFLKEPNINAYSKGAVLDAIIQIGLHEPTRKPEVVNVLVEVMEFFIAHSADTKNICDPDFCAFLTMGSINLMDERLMELTRTFFAEEMVSGFADDLDDLEAEFAEGELHASHIRRKPSASAIEEAAYLKPYYR